MSSAEEDDDDEWSSVVQAPEFDAKVVHAILGCLQKRGSNVLMDELLEAAEVEEWDVARVLDVLVSLQLAGVERQRGNNRRSSRAFAYRSGIELPRAVPLDRLKELVAKQETMMQDRVSRIKRLKTQLETGKPESDRSFLKEFVEGNTGSNAELIKKFLDNY